MTSLMRKLAIVAAVLAVCLCLTPLAPSAMLTKALADGGNLLANGTFEDNDGTVPTDWESDCWDHEEGYSLFTMDLTGGTDGKAAACVTNAEQNDARFQQKVDVKKGKLYRLSGDIKVEGAEGDWGATLSFKDTYTHTEPLYNTNGEWKHVEVYARASNDQASTTVYIRLGGYGSLTLGSAWFDNVVLEEVDSLPQGAVEGTMATSSSSGGSTEGTDTKANNYLSQIILIAFLFGALLLYAFKHIKDADDIFSGKLNYLLYVAGILLTGNLLAVFQLFNKDYSWTLHVFYMIGIGLVPALLLLVIKRSLNAKNKRWIDMVYVAFIALTVRFVIAYSIRGYQNDIDCWLGWASQASSNLFGMYKSGGFLDYPPGYMYVLAIVGKINSILPVEQFQVMMCKLPSILADIGTAYMIYRLAINRLSTREAAIISLLYLFNPLVILDSSAWGQIDSILALIVVGCFWQVYRNKLWPAALLYGLGLLIKPQMLLFAPVLFGALVVASWNTHSLKKGSMMWLKSAGAFLGGFIVPALPFWIIQGDPMWLPNLYLKATGTYDSASVNACNMLALLGGNWVADSQKVFGLSYAAWGWMGMAAVGLFSLYMMIFRERTNRRIFFWAALMITGIFVLGLRMHERYMFPAVALLLIYYVLERDRRALYLFGMFSMTQFLNVAMVLANKHMPTDVLRFGDLFAIANPEGSIWVFLISLSAVVAYAYMVYSALKLNRPLLKLPAGCDACESVFPRDDSGVTADDSYQVNQEPYTMPEAVHTSPASDIAPETKDETSGEEHDTEQDEVEKLPPDIVTAVEERRRNRLERIKNDLAMPLEASRIRLAKKDWLIMGALTLAYAILSLVYLGTTQVPQTMWQAMRTGDNAIVDFGTPVDVSQIWCYNGLTKGNLQVSTSDDGLEWTDQQEIKYKTTVADEKITMGIYRWDIVSASFTARYVKLSVTAPPVRLLEMVFKDADGNIITPVSISGADANGKADESVKYVIDEPQMTPERPSFFNGMYFDEIYHARTGWEFVEGLTPYENTHPPLGKDIISVGILIFGMNPFGWRVMGTLMGILMVPAMYLFGMAVFKKRRYAFITAFLMTFDFMHFVQTRIATIDSYGVLFIILTFMFMFLYLNTNFNTQKLRHTLLPLALSGITFGLAAASKWIGLYAGVGLALIFFYSLYRRWKEYDAVRKGDVELDEETRRFVLNGFAKKVLITLLWCALFFIIIAGIIYFASYIPFNIGTGGNLGSWDNFKIALDNQTSMYNYHSNLVDNHPFKSPWYEWPAMIKPMWFYKADYLPQGMMGSIATFGNPAVWWAGLAALVWLVLRVFRSKKFRLPEMFILAGFLTEFLPWVLVPRTMFIYHYFASVPFFIIAIVMYIREWEQKKTLPTDRNPYIQAIITLVAAVVVAVFMSPLLACLVAVFLVLAIALYKRHETADLYKKDVTHIYLAVVLALFVLFYPVLSGLPIPSWYGAWLKWMPTWWFTY